MCGSKTVNNTTTQSGSSSADLPDWAKPYFERNIAKAEAEFSKPFEAYGGERIATNDPSTEAARAGTLGIAGTGLAGLGAAQDFTQAGMDRASELGQYDPTQFSEFNFQQPDTFTGDAVSQYMSPYMQNVTDVQKEQAIRDFNRLGGQRQAQAVQSGAFGGSRAAVQEGLAEEGLLDRMAQIQATGQQRAFDSASQQFGADRTAQMTVDQQRAAELGRVQTGTEAGQQFGAGQGLAALEAGQGLAGDLTRFGELGRQTDIQNMQLLEGVGAAEQADAQRQIDMDYQNFLEEQGFGREQIGNMTGILSGMPIAATGTNTFENTQTGQSQQPGAFQQLAGAGLSGLSLYKAFS